MEAALKPAAPSAVTVVITSCNQGALIREAVESALAELGAPGRDGAAPAVQFAPVLEKSSLYQFPSCPPTGRDDSPVRR
ncbi:glycosyltransferase family 2 protein [Bifidobacterium bifidum]|nr:glycosyltransferase family 2 protein [Bifidobacterium bifidum]